MDREAIKNLVTQLTGEAPKIQKNETLEQFQIRSLKWCGMKDLEGRLLQWLSDQGKKP